MPYFYYPLSAFINAITSILLGSFVLSRNIKAPTNRSFAYFAFSVGFWSCFYSLWQISTDATKALFWCRVLMAGAIFIPSAFLHFCINLIDKRKEYLKTIILGYLGSVIFLILDFTPLYIPDVKPRLIFPFWPTAGIAYAPFLAMFIGLTFYAHVLLFKEYKKASGFKRHQILYVFLGTAIGFIGGTTNYPLWYDINILPIGNILVSVYVASVAYAIIRHHLMDIEVLIKKTLVFASLFTVIFGVFVGITILTQELIGGGRLLGLAISSLVIIFMARPMEDFLIRITDKYLFQKEYDHQRLRKEISQGIVGKIDLESLRIFIANVLQEKMKIENIAIVDEDTILSRWHMNNNAPLLYDTVDYIARRKKIDLSHLKNHMRELKASVSVPVFFKDAVFWLILLGDKKSGRVYSSEDIGILDALSHEIAIAIENAINFQELKRSQIELLRQDNLKFVSVLVKGLAHEIFNPLMPLMHKIEDLEGEDLIKIYEIYEKNKSKLDKNEEIKFRSSLLSLRESTKSLKTNASHIHLIVDTLSKLEKGDEKTIGPLDVKSFFKEIVSLFGLEVEPNLQQGILVNQNIAQNLPPVKANPTLLKQIFINLYKNSCYAMKNSPIKTIDIDCEISEANENELKIIFSDTGAGIPPAVISEIFSYGFTTKGSKGSGIGLNQCKAIIEKFGGTIIIESEESKGTRIIINVPIWEEGVKNVA